MLHSLFVLFNYKFTEIKSQVILNLIKRTFIFKIVLIFVSDQAERKLIQIFLINVFFCQYKCKNCIIATLKEISLYVDAWLMMNA